MFRLLPTALDVQAVSGPARLRLLAALLAAGFIAAALMPPRAGTAQRVRETPCRGVITGTISAGPLSVCTEAEVSTGMASECPVCPGGLNVIFVQLDRAPQNGWQNQESIKVLDAIQAWVVDREPELIQASVVHYDANAARVVLRRSDDLRRVRGRLNASQNGYYARGAVVEAARAAVQQLREMRREAGGDTPCEIVVMFAHVKNHDAHAAQLREAAQMIKRERVTFLVGCPIAPGQWYCRVEAEMPTSRRYFSEFSESGKLQGAARQDLRGFEPDTRVREASIIHQLPPGLLYVNDSASKDPAEVDVTDEGTVLTWTWADAAARAEQGVSYRVRASEPGSYQVAGSLELVDTSARTRTVDMAALPELTFVDEMCVPPTPTTVPTPTPTASDTPPPPTVTPTATPSRYIIYLPVLVRTECEVSRQYIDVALIIDASTSMRRLTIAGRPKMAAAQEAALVFMDLMQLTPDANGGHDQLAVVGFNRDGWIEQALTNDTAALRAAVEILPERMMEYTRLDLALDVGLAALTGPQRRPDSTALMILMTDGLPNQVPYAEDGTMETTVLRYADLVKAAEIALYTVGVGAPDAVDPIDRINVELLRQVASSPEMFFQTPDAEELSSIYSAIAATFGCPRGWQRSDEP